MLTDDFDEDLDLEDSDDSSRSSKSLRSPSPRTFSKRARFLLQGFVTVALLIPAGLLVAVMLQHPEPEKDPSYVPQGYYDRVTEMIREGALYLEEGEIRIAQEAKLEGLQGGDPQKVSAFKNYREFVDNSSKLERDIEAFNESPQRSRYGGHLFFYTEGYDRKNEQEGKLRINESAHRIQLPYPPRERYEGIQQKSATSLISSDLELRLLRRSVRNDSKPKMLTHGEWQNGREAGIADSLFHFYNSSGARFLSLELVDGRLVAECFANTPKVSINGQSINRSDSSDETVEFRERHESESLSADQWELRIDDRLTLGEKDFVVSSKMDVFNQETTPLGIAFRNALSQLIQQEKYRDKALSFVAEMTIDNPLHASAQKALSARARQSAVDRPAAFTIMDTENGHVLALATWPTQDYVDNLAQMAEAGEISLSQRRKQRLEMNQNFARVSVGSQTKPVLGSAVWQVRKDLRNLVVDSQTWRLDSKGGVGWMVGNTFGGFESSGGGPWDHESGIFNSSNQYFIQLFMLGLSEPSSLKFRSNGAVSPNGISYAPYLSGSRVDQLEKAPQSLALRDAYDIEIETVLYSDPRMSYDGSLLQPLLDHLEVGDNPEDLPDALRSLSMERTNLQLNHVLELRGDMISLVLGGATNLWSTTKLAEAFSRISSGKKVEATLLKRIDQNDPDLRELPPTFEVMPIDSEVLEFMQAGLSKTATQGTASRTLGNTLPSINSSYSSKQVKFRILSKTGTGRTGKINNGSYAFVVEMLDFSGTRLGGLTGTIYLEHRPTSAEAVRVSKPLIPEMAKYLYDTYGQAR